MISQLPFSGFEAPAHGPVQPPRDLRNETNATIAMLFGVNGFFAPRVPPAPFQPRGTLGAISYYDTEPLPGKYPLPVVGPMDLLKETRANHLGKLAFRWVYWHVLLPGRPVPLPAHMSMIGKNDHRSHDQQEA